MVHTDELRDLVALRVHLRVEDFPRQKVTEFRLRHVEVPPRLIDVAELERHCKSGDAEAVRWQGR